MLSLFSSRNSTPPLPNTPQPMNSSYHSPPPTPPLSSPSATAAAKYANYLSPTSSRSGSSMRSTPQPLPQQQIADPETVIDENVCKIKNEYIYSNGSLFWISEMPCYIVNTGIMYDEVHEIRILYVLRGPRGLKKRYGYFDLRGVFQECEMV